jgi:cytochrome c oxidase cbb3-type subunit 3
MKRVFILAVLLSCCAVLPAAAQRRGAAPPGPPNPFAGSAQAVQDGRDLFNQNCTACHGLNGAGGGTAQPLDSTARGYVRITDGQIFDAVKNGIAGTLMPAWSGKLSDDEVWKVSAFVRALHGMAIDAPMPGDVAAGEQVYMGKGQCSNCHMLHGKGSTLGPDLSDVAGRRKASAIINALTKDQHRVYGNGGTIPHAIEGLSTYPAVQVTDAKGKTITGVLKNEDSYSLQVMGTDQQLHSYDRANVKLVYEPKSLMPTDYDKRLTPDEFKNLVAFLTRQAQAPPAAAPGRGGGPD